MVSEDQLPNRFHILKALKLSDCQTIYLGGHKGVSGIISPSVQLQINRCVTNSAVD